MRLYFPVTTGLPQGGQPQDRQNSETAMTLVIQQSEGSPGQNTPPTKKKVAGIDSSRPPWFKSRLCYGVRTRKNSLPVCGITFRYGSPVGTSRYVPSTFVELWSTPGNGVELSDRPARGAVSKS